MNTFHIWEQSNSFCFAGCIHRSFMITGKGLQKQLPKLRPAKTCCHPKVPQRQKAKPLLSKVRFYSDEQEHEKEPAVSGYCTQGTTNTGKDQERERQSPAESHKAHCSSQHSLPSPWSQSFSPLVLISKQSSTT